MSDNPVFHCGIASKTGDSHPAHISFPAANADVREAFRLAGMDTRSESEYLLSDFESALPGLRCVLGEKGSIDELNYLANLIAELRPEERLTFEAVLTSKSTGRAPADYINLVLNLDTFTLLDGIRDETDYGLLLREENVSAYSGLIEKLEQGKDVTMQALALYIRSLEKYFDAGRYGADMAAEEKGCFTPYGYLFGGEEMEQKYDGRSIPKQYCVTGESRPFRVSRGRVRGRSVRAHRERAY